MTSPNPLKTDTNQSLSLGMYEDIELETQRPESKCVEPKNEPLSSNYVLRIQPELLTKKKLFLLPLNYLIWNLHNV